MTTNKKDWAKAYISVEMSKLRRVAICPRHRGEGVARTRLIDAAAAILQEQRPMTIRQLFYRLLGIGQIDNTKQDYQRVSRAMTVARKDERCPYEWIVDRNRPTYRPNVWDDTDAYLETVKKSYRRDCWQDQPCHVEVWTEKDTIIGSIEGVTSELGVSLRVFRGFSSTTRAHEIAEHFAQLGDKSIHVFYLGDHDPSGIDIERDIADRIREFSRGKVSFSIKRIAIHAADITKFNLPPQRVKDTDSRCKTFIGQHGDKCVELDALPPKELRERLRTAIESLIEPEAWNRHVAAEQIERTSIIDFVNKMKNLPQIGGAL